MRLSSLVCGSLLLAACATPPLPMVGLSSIAATSVDPESGEPVGANAASQPTTALADEFSLQGPPQGGHTTGRWRPGEAALTGFIGAQFLTLEADGGAIATIDDDISFPTIGGGGQWKVAGDNLDFGLEGLLQFSWRGDTAAVAIGGGGAAVAVDVDLLLFDLYGGPFISTFIDNRVRLYAGAGPVLRWGGYDQEGSTALTSGDGDGFGVGYYARAGIEFAVSRGTMLGICARWTDVEIDLSGRLGDLTIDGIDALVTITQGF
jgi:hypothetical protein